MSWDLFQNIIQSDGLVQQGSEGCWAYRERTGFAIMSCMALRCILGKMRMQ